MIITRSVADLFLTNMHWIYGLAGIYFFIFASWYFLLFFIITSIIGWCTPYTMERGKGWNIYNQMFRAYAGHEPRIVLMESKDKYKSCVFGFHPHGILPMAIWECGSYFPFSECVAIFGSQMSAIPWYKFFIGNRGQALTADSKNIKECLKKGKSIVLCPGGIQEMFRNGIVPDKLDIVTYHLGFIKYAIEFGRPVVPVVALNECRRYRNPGRIIERLTYRLLRVPICPIYTNDYGMPFSNMIQNELIVGTPIETRDRSIDEVQIEFYEQWKQLYSEYKVDGMPDVCLLSNSDKKAL